MANVLVYQLIKALFLILFVSAITSSNSLEKSWKSRKICKSKECKSAARYLRSSMNLDVNPCDNFYKYACGNWGEIYGSGSTFSQRREKIDIQKLEFLKKENSDDEHPAIHKARKYFSLCLSDDDIRKSSDLMKDIIQKIEISNEDYNDSDYAKKFAHIARTIGYKFFFDLRVIPNPYNKTVNMISLSDPDSPKYRKMLWYQPNDGTPTSYLRKHDLREIIREKCQNTDKFDCIRVIQNQILSEDFMKIEQRKNKEKSATFLRDDLPKIYTLKQLQNISDTIAIEANSDIFKFNWTRYVEDMFANINGVVLNLDNPTTIEIAIEDVDYIKLMIERIYQLDDKEMDLIIFVEIYFGILDESYYRIRNNESSETRCMESAQAKFPLAIDYLYVQQEKYKEIIPKARKLFNSIRSSFASIIQKSSWIEKQTRKRTLNKLNRMNALIAFPNIEKFHEILDKYNNIIITEDYLNTRIAINLYYIQNELRTLNRINDYNEQYWWLWITTFPSEVNAVYYPHFNTAIFPAAILGAPFFTDSLDVLNYGSIGSIMGHEITHGFDNTGIRYNEFAQHVSWWDKKSAKIYDDKTKCFLDAYDKYGENTTLTIGENISDNGALHAILLAYRKYVSLNQNEPLLPHFENFTYNQLITLAYANTWCADSYTSTEYGGGEHSSRIVRVNEVYRNSAEFSRIWKCPRGSEMNPKKKCTLW